MGIGGQLRELLAAFYADNGIIASRDTVLLQHVMYALVAVFAQDSLIINTKKTKGIVCTPGQD